MSSIGSSIPSVYTNVVTSSVPLGRPPVGLESSDLKTSSFKSLEQPASSARSENRRSAEDNPADQARVEPAPGKEDQQDSTSQAQDDKRQQAQQQSKAAQQAQLVQDQTKIAELSARDREVRAHEQAHAAVGGQYAGSPTYEFVKGPDGVNYAVSGEVAISAGSVPNDPQATIAKAQQIRAAANAPADPSGPDRAVAAAADNMEANARIELSAKRNSEIQEQERKQEEDVKLQKAEEAERAAKEQELRQEERDKRNQVEARQAQEAEAERAARRSAERIDGYTQLNNKTFDINRHLVDIGAVGGGTVKGSFLNQQA